MILSAFPDFTKLRFEHREQYNNFVADYPPVSDLSFSTLMIWWNFARDLRVAKLNDNLVIVYHLPGDVKNSGLCLVGARDVDESIQTLFAYCRDIKKKPLLVHVPGFVVDNIRFQDRLNIQEEQDYNEYIVPVRNFFPLEGASHNTRRKVKKFLLEVNQDVSVRCLELSDKDNQDLLLASAHQWLDESGAPNDRTGSEERALQTSVRQAKELNIENVCLYVHDRLEAFVLYQISHDERYIIVSHIKTHYAIPRIFEYATYIVAEMGYRQNIPYLNMEMDLGISGIRTHKAELKPTDFFRKYRISPKIS